MQSPVPQPVSTRDKLIFWLLLGGLSAVSAEGVSSSTLFPFFTFWGWLAFSAENGLIAFISALSNIGVLIGLGWLWQRIRAGRNLTFRDLLPSNKDAVVLAVLFLVTVTWQVILIRPESLPRTLGPHLTVWIMYLGLFALLFFNVKRAPQITEPPQPAPFSGQALGTGILLGAIIPI